MSMAEVDRIETAGSSAMTRLADTPSPWTVCDALDPPLWVWRTPKGDTRIGAGQARRIVAEGETRFGAIADSLGTLTSGLERDTAGPRAFVGACFFADPTPGTPWTGYPAAIAAVPNLQLVWSGPETTVSVLDATTSGPPTRRLAEVVDRLASIEPPERMIPAVTDRRFEPSRGGYQAMVAAAIERLGRPPLEKVVLGGTLRLELDASPPLGAVLASLARRHPDCWIFAYAPSDTSVFVGATPERLVSVAGDHLETVALAGSIGRGETAVADDRLAERLLDRERGRHEHASVVGDIVRRLGPLTEAVRVGGRSVRRLADVQHIETPIEARLRDGVGLLDVAGRLHPTPAVGGRPRASALAAIRELEPIDRGWYAGPIGVIDPAGDGTLAVAIRSARIDRTMATLYAGNG
ncbi:MAG: isochorismate synthase, partial [Halobacteriota archaeon]